MKKGDEPIIVEQSYHASMETVWKAITEVEQMRQWFFANIPSFNPEIGFETKFNIQSHERNFLHLWKVTEVVPLRRLRYGWKFGGYPGDSYVVFELFKEDHSTKLRLTAQVLEDFPEDIPEFQRESCIEGWNYFIKKSLKEFLESKETS
jgi:uncharacterized protein YndB with AHSA1/START domain